MIPQHEKQTASNSHTHRIAWAMLAVGALSTGVATKLALLVFNLDSGSVSWTPASDGQYGVWALGTASVLNATAIIASWKGKNLVSLPVLAAIITMLSCAQAVLSGFGRVPRVGTHRVLVTDIPRQWTTLAGSTHLQVRPGPALALVAAAILLSGLAAWFFHRDRVAHLPG